MLEQADCAVKDWDQEQVQRLGVVVVAAKEAVAADAAINRGNGTDRRVGAREQASGGTTEYGKPVCAAPFGLQSTERIEVE